MVILCFTFIFLFAFSEEGGMEAQIDQKQTEKMLYLQNKAPKWDETHGGHVLNFQVWLRWILFVLSIVFLLS